MLISLVLALGVLSAPPARASFPGENGLIAYVRSPDFTSTDDIYVLPPDGSGSKTQLTTTGDAHHPAWSADGTQIAYDRSNKGIWVMNSDGSSVHRVAKVGTRPTWSPDGSLIAFELDHDGGSDVAVVKAGGGKGRQLTTDGDSGYPRWSPDGSLILFMHNGAVAVMNADGTDQDQLTQGFLGEWSPDGALIACINEFYAPGFDDYLGNIMVMNADGSDKVRLTTSSSKSEGSTSWSPDGRYIAVESTDWLFNSAIYLVNADSGSADPLTNPNDDAEEFDPAWQPVQ